MSPHPPLALLDALSFGMEGLIETATGPVGLFIVFVYSFLIAFALPGVSEVVLAAPLNLGLPEWVELGLIILVSGLGKAAGSVFAYHLGQTAKESGPVTGALERLGFDVMSWSRSRTMEIANRWGVAGLAVALCFPFFPDTLSIYAFSVLDTGYVRFTVATFLGSVGRLLITIGLVRSALVVV